MALTVEVVYAPDISTVRLAAGASLHDAIVASGVLKRHPEAEGLKTGIFGELAGPETVLKEGDRVEIYRPLAVDPKEARRRRAAAGRGRKTRV
jgi:putative ubiquitin-RnfH superfamily antitoxin RatB of RatAB toxin-antitoxin module